MVVVFVCSHSLTIPQGQGASVGFGIDATKPEIDDYVPGIYDIIIFNFPHTDVDNMDRLYDSIESNKQLLLKFFKNITLKLKPEGEIHVRIPLPTPA